MKLSFRLPSLSVAGLAALCLSAFALTACDDENANEYHATYFYPMSTYGIETYADQSVDSIRVISSDSWTLQNSCEWCTISSNGQLAPLSINIPQGYIASTRLDFKLQPNTTGKLRTNRIDVASSYDKVGTISQLLVQYPNLNITHPDGVATGTGTEYAVTYTLSVPAEGVSPSGAKPYVKFTVYAEGATLTSSADWIESVQTAGFAKYEAQSVELNVQPNPTKESRTAMLVLCSSGVETPITVTQLAQKVE